MTVMQRLATALADRYRVEKELGAGGMATVYLAHDLRHERDVAIKVLHPDLGAALGAERFLAEIKTTAKLQHPHILPLLDSGAADGLLFYVMPFVRGETLRAKLDRERQLAIDDAVQIAAEVGDALAAAHALGIVHRDIKPENILLKDGHALVADFGIALAVQTAGGQRMTQTGLSLGTPQYMSPEQAVGDKAVDARSDLYSLAAVTYEMLTGDPPFQGNNVQAIIARIISSEPEPVLTLRKTVPPALAAAVMKGLAKLPADRHADVRQFVAACQSRETVTAPFASPASRPPRWRARLASLVVLAAGVGGGWTLRGSALLGTAPPSVAADNVALSVELPPEVVADNTGRAVAISPDGRVAMVVGLEADGTRRLYRRRIDQAVAEPIDGTTGAAWPTFSPDGKWLAFVANGVLRKIPVMGGPVVDLLEVGVLYGIAWPNSSTLVLGTGAGLERLNADGGERRLLYAGRSNQPFALPDGKSVLYAEWTGGLVSARVRHRALDAKESTPFGLDSIVPLGVVPGGIIAALLGGRLGFVPTTADYSRATGPAKPVLEGVLPYGDVGQAVVSASGALLYQPGSIAADVVRLDPATTRAEIVSDDARQYMHPRLSPDGKRYVVTAAAQGDYDLRVIELADRSVRRISMPGSQVRPEWAPDGASVLFEDIQGDTETIRARQWNGNGPARDVQRRTGGNVTDVSVSPDANAMLFRLISGKSMGLFWRAMTGDTTLHPFLSSAGLQYEPRFAPNGDWLAWRESEGAAAPEVYVARFPSAERRLQVSDRNGEQPVWSHDGRALYYVTARGRMVVKATLALDGEPRVVRRDTVVRSGFDLYFNVGHQNFDVFPDGTLLLLRRPPAARFPVLITNWWRGTQKTEAAP
jgi:serine/threonine-protein kinase